MVLWNSTPNEDRDRPIEVQLGDGEKVGLYLGMETRFGWALSDGMRLLAADDGSKRNGQAHLVKNCERESP